MLAQEKTSGHQSNSVLSSENTASMVVCVQSLMEEDQIPKIRKPYTITKQRERWTGEEHDRFLEALKLHGRAWRKIEDHIGTKTAVQIRSHAQKFFSKVVRETSNSNASSTEPIEIPPPRPKRKPSHPYPRKLVLPAKKENHMNHHARSTSPSSPIYEQQNGSPTSVLPDLASDTRASADLAAPDVSPSPLSSNEDVSQAEFVPSDDNAPKDDVQAPQSVPNDRISVKLELFPGIESVDKPESVATTKVLKLFGKDVVVPSEPFDSSLCLSKSPSSDMGEELLQASQPMDIAMQSAENSWDCQTLYYVDGNGNQVEKPIPLPWWVFFRGIAVPSFQCQFQTPREKESQREGSCAGSSSESVNAVGSSDNNWDAESKVESDMEKRQNLLEKRSNTSKASKGFLPYKRCFSDRDVQSSNELCINEEEGRRIRLCL